MIENTLRAGEVGLLDLLLTFLVFPEVAGHHHFPGQSPRTQEVAHAGSIVFDSQHIGAQRTFHLLGQASSQRHPCFREWLREKEALRERVNALIDVIHELHPRQKLAATCALQDCARDVPAMRETLREREMDGEGWSQDEYERHLLQSSLSPARRKLKRLLKEQEK